MENAFYIQPATNGGSGPWALSLMVAISKHSDQLSTEEILAIFRCIQSLSDSSYIRIPVIDFWLSIFLEYGNNPDICSEGIVTLGDLVSKHQTACQLLNEDEIKDIICCGENSKVLSDDEVFKCRYALEYGINGIKIEKTNSYIFLPILVKILKGK